MKKTMIVEPVAGGHREHFLGILTEDLLHSSTPVADLVFVVSEASIVKYPEWVTVDRIPEGDLEGLGGVQRKQAMGRLLQRMVRQHEPDAVLLLELTQFEWSLLWTKLPVALSAIVFVQPPFIPSKFKRAFKMLKTRRILQNNQWDSLFFLNGEAAVREMKVRFPSAASVFKALPDPMVQWEGIIPNRPDVRPDRIKALYFGAISRRKGFSQLVDALTKLPERVGKKLQVLICGQPEDQGYCEKECLRLKHGTNHIHCHIVTRYLEEDEVRGYFEASDWVLMPYTRPEYSSGILGLAARSGKPVLGPEEGLLGHLIRTYELGACCKIHGDALRSAIEKAVTVGLPFSAEKAEEYVQKNNASSFAEILLAGISA